MFKIGCHLSVADGFLAMAKDAMAINANTFQFFTRNPRGGNAKAIDEKDIAAFRELAKKQNFSIILAHASYTMNVCAADEKIGQGYLGLETFSKVINHPKLRHLPFYLETPNELEGYAEEIALLRGLYN
jgi:endonuclease IV